MRIAYLCNGKVPKCKDSSWCIYNGCKDGCDHTLDEDYALHGKCDAHPSMFPERFIQHFENVDDWWEKKSY